DLIDLINLATTENEAFFSKYCLDPPVKELFLMPVFENPAKLQLQLKALNNEFLKTFFTISIDLENIRSWLRIKHLAELQKQDTNEQKKFFIRHFLPNGTLKLSSFSELFSYNYDDFIRWLANTSYKSCVEAGIDYLLANNSFIRLERLIEEEKQKVLLNARYAVFGYEPLVAYFLFRKYEITNMLKISYGLIEGSPVSEIRESIACIL
ncbi:MAG: V-type ATPase subunit, partial [candidate division WOR-3 bacterium]|nr:V-type ATPase subunit [candidate division WOR-3 bacterium]